MWFHNEHEERKIVERLDIIIILLSKLLGLELGPTGVSIRQLGGAMITGVNAGGSGTFEADPVPSTTIFPTGSVDTWTTDDPTIQLTPNGNQVVASVPATATEADFGLTVSVQMPGGGAPLTSTVRVPIIPLPPPPPTGVVINQVA